MMASRSFKQKQNDIVSSQPFKPDRRIASLIAVGPRTAASCVSSDILVAVRLGSLGLLVEALLCHRVIVCHRPCHAQEADDTCKWEHSRKMTLKLLNAHPSKKEKPLLPHPEPSVTWVKTHFALGLFGVKTKRVMQIAMDARTDIDQYQKSA